MIISETVFSKKEIKNFKKVLFTYCDEMRRAVHNSTIKSLDGIDETLIENYNAKIYNSNYYQECVKKYKALFTTIEALKLENEYFDFLLYGKTKGNSLMGRIEI